MTHPFDKASALTSVDQNRLSGHTSPVYANLVGPFGGITSASLMRAVLEDDRRVGDPISMTVNFCAAVADGPYVITRKCARAGKYIQHWSLELVQGDRTCATATLVLARRLADFSHQPVPAPDVPAPEECAAYVPPKNIAYSNWINTYEYRYIEGSPPYGKPPKPELQPAISALWVKDVPDRPLDYLSLMALSDCFLIRLFHVRGTLVPMGTVTLTTHFIGSMDEIAEQGSAHLLGIADATRFHGNFHDQSMQLFSRTGKLLATGSQVVWFKE